MYKISVLSADRNFCAQHNNITAGLAMHGFCCTSLLRARLLKSELRSWKIMLQNAFF